MSAPTIAFNGLTLASAFQPIYAVKDGRAIGYEALVRATADTGEPVRASQLFESLDAVETVSLDRTCRTLHLRSFAAVDPGAPMLFLNTHPTAAVADAALASQVKSRIGYFGLTPDRVCVEVLESCCDDEGRLVEAIAAFREMGLAIAMDDFGIARSNFDRVAGLRPDYVKLDRSILIDAMGDERSRRMLPSVIEILHEAGTRVVMEGIEDASEALLSIESGADFLQGYYFAPPAATLHDDCLTERILRELVRMRGARPVFPHEHFAQAPQSAVGKLLNSARRTPPTPDSPLSYTSKPARSA